MKDFAGVFLEALNQFGSIEFKLQKEE